MKYTSKTLGWVLAVTLILAGSAAARPGYGTLSGVVLDPSGTPQMGATVWLISEDAGGRTVSQLLSNQYGAFFSDRLKPGSYAVRVSLAGFLPAMERHIGVAANLTTLIRVQVDSVFASLDTLRRKSDVPAEPDDWKWVLRSSAATRTILQLRAGDPNPPNNALSADSSAVQRPRGLVQLTSGALRPGSPSNLSDSPATALSYDQKLGRTGRLLLAGQTSYEQGSASGAFAGVWLPSGAFGRGAETTFVMRQAKVGSNGLEFQGMRMDHSQQLVLNDRVTLRVGAEYVRVGVISLVSAVHPHAQLDTMLAPSWTASFLVAASPLDAGLENTTMLQSAIAELDTLPTVLFRDGRPVLQGGWHQEVSVKHKAGRRSFEGAAFHDIVQHDAIYGSGLAANPDFFQDEFSRAFLYDGGGTNSWGARLAFRQKISDKLSVAAVYSWAGALSPIGELDTTSGDLRNGLATRQHNSLAPQVSGKLPGSGTQLAASYKWISGATLARLDRFGEAAYQVDPGLHLSIHQPLPGFGLGCRWEALADFSNLLAQGYVPVHGQASRVVVAPVMRSFRGGVSFQF